MAHENWRAIPGFEEFYSASDLGRVRSEGRIVTPKDGARPYHVEGRIMRPSPDGHGYLRVNLRLGGRTTQTSVHQCVAIAFLGPCPRGMECRHKNGIATDCRAVNLEYGTRSQNIADAKRHGTFPLGVKRPNAKITPDIARSIFLSTRPAEELAEQHGLSVTHIYAIWSGRTWSDFTKDLSGPPRKPPGNPKISADDARSIFLSAETDAQAAIHYGVTRQAIRHIRRGLTWKEVTTGLITPRRPRSVTNRGIPAATVRAIFEDVGTFAQIAIRHGVSRQTVYLVKNGKTRKEITRPQAVCPDPPPVPGPDFVVGGAAETGAVGQGNLDNG
jgi:hypothetical protein